MVKPILFQLVGYQNSGKTTSMYEVINRLSTQGYKVVTIKHHGHGGKPDMVENKDSGRHVDAGAFASLIEGEGRVLLQAEKADWRLAEQIQLVTALNPDTILIEGHKHEVFPKAVLLRDERDLHLLEELTNIKVILSRQPELASMLQKKLSYPVYSEVEDFYSWIVNYIETAVLFSNKQNHSDIKK
ncbi:MAG: molybdopterin-guanine dinucleotide biosynthesis protein B [Bacillota bacterium]